MPPVLVEVEALGQVGVDVLEAERVVVPLDDVGVALQLAHHRPGVDVVDAEEPAPLGDDPEVDAVVLLPGPGGVAGAVEVEEHPVAPGPLRHRGHGRVADGEVLHDDDAADVAGELGPLVHVLHGGGGHVHVVALDLTGHLLGPVDGLHAEQEPVPPAHERLAVDVLVVLGEVEPAPERLVDDPAVVAGGEAQLGLDGGAEERPAVLVEVLPFHDDAVGRAGERLHVVGGDAEVLEAQGLEGLEPEDVADDRRRQVGDRPFLEEVDVVGDVGHPLALDAGDGIDPVALRLVVLVGREAVGPHHRPRGGRRLAGHRCPRLLRVDPGLRRDPEGTQDVGVFRDVIRVVVAHLGVRRDAG